MVHLGAMSGSYIGVSGAEQIKATLCCRSTATSSRQISTSTDRAGLTSWSDRVAISRARRQVSWQEIRRWGKSPRRPGSRSAVRRITSCIGTYEDQSRQRNCPTPLWFRPLRTLHPKGGARWNRFERAYRTYRSGHTVCRRESAAAPSRHRGRYL